ncbi:MAG: MGMT family protein [Patescibacteria group bacterium]|nr:MGMT family protein [Patescibacteria group bacterium]
MNTKENKFSFKNKVYAVTKKIPKGKVASYKQIARLAKNPNAARAVGAYMRTNPYAPQVPCHRVVASNGALTGYSGKGGVRGKQKLLQAEGVYFLKNGRVDMKKSGWKK